VADKGPEPEVGQRPVDQGGDCAADPPLVGETGVDEFDVGPEDGIHIAALGKQQLGESVEVP
jgi:hypothetical protein